MSLFLFYCIHKCLLQLTLSRCVVLLAAESFIARAARSSWYCLQFIPSWMDWGEQKIETKKMMHKDWNTDVFEQQLAWGDQTNSKMCSANCFFQKLLLWISSKWLVRGTVSPPLVPWLCVQCRVYPEHRKTMSLRLWEQMIKYCINCVFTLYIFLTLQIRQLCFLQTGQWKTLTVSSYTHQPRQSGVAQW